MGLQLPQGTHYGIVFHGGDQHMVTRAQKAFEQHIEALRHISGKCHRLGTRPSKEVAEGLARLVDLLLRLIGLLIASPVDVFRLPLPDDPAPGRR